MGASDLRPNGASGLMVSSVDAFREYQEKDAWVWEHQALTRARYCAGDAKVGAAFEAERSVHQRQIVALPFGEKNHLLLQPSRCARS